MDGIVNKDQLNNNPIFYRAVVENRVDPKKLGRVQVRILGIHPCNAKRTGKNKGVILKDLPWAEVSVSTSYTGGMSGKGVSAVPLQGTWVWCFLDGGDWNRPIIIGIIYGISNEQRPDDKSVWGFHDPDKVYPIKKRLNESDMNRLCCRRKVDETIIKTIKDADRDEGITTAKGDTWDELKECTSKAKYPDNKVIELVQGSFIEHDDTSGNHRIHYFHKTGTYWEIVEKGDYTMKVKRDHYEIIDRDCKRLVKRDEFHTVRRNQEYKIDKDQTILISGESKETIKKKVTQIYKDTQTTTVTKAVKEIYKDTQTTLVDKAVKEIYKDTKFENVKKILIEKYDGGETIDAGPFFIVKAGIISLN